MLDFNFPRPRSQLPLVIWARVYTLTSMTRLERHLKHVTFKAIQQRKLNSKTSYARLTSIGQQLLWHFAEPLLANSKASKVEPPIVVKAVARVHGTLQSPVTNGIASSTHIVTGKNAAAFCVKEPSPVGPGELQRVTDAKMAGPGIEGMALLYNQSFVSGRHGITFTYRITLGKSRKALGTDSSLRTVVAINILHQGYESWATPQHFESCHVSKSSREILVASLREKTFRRLLDSIRIALLGLQILGQVKPPNPVSGLEFEMQRDDSLYFAPRESGYPRISACTRKGICQSRVRGEEHAKTCRISGTLAATRNLSTTPEIKYLQKACHGLEFRSIMFWYTRSPISGSPAASRSSSDSTGRSRKPSPPSSPTGRSLAESSRVNVQAKQSAYLGLLGIGNRVYQSMVRRYCVCVDVAGRHIEPFLLENVRVRRLAKINKQHLKYSVRDSNSVPFHSPFVRVPVLLAVRASMPGNTTPEISVAAQLSGRQYIWLCDISLSDETICEIASLSRGCLELRDARRLFRICIRGYSVALEVPKTAAVRDVLFIHCSDQGPGAEGGSKRGASSARQGLEQAGWGQGLAGLARRPAYATATFIAALSFARFVAQLRRRFHLLSIHPSAPTSPPRVTYPASPITFSPHITLALVPTPFSHSRRQEHRNLLIPPIIQFIPLLKVVHKCSNILKIFKRLHLIDSMVVDSRFAHAKIRKRPRRKSNPNNETASGADTSQPGIFTPPAPRVLVLSRSWCNYPAPRVTLKFQGLFLVGDSFTPRNPLVFLLPRTRTPCSTHAGSHVLTIALACVSGAEYSRSCHEIAALPPPPRHCGDGPGLSDVQGIGAAVAERLACSPPTKTDRLQSSFPDFRKWESCRTMPVVFGFSPGSPISPALAFRRFSTQFDELGADEGEMRNGAAPDCKGGGNGKSLRKPADQRFPFVLLFALVGDELSNCSATAAFCVLVYDHKAMLLHTWQCTIRYLSPCESNHERAAEAHVCFMFNPSPNNDENLAGGGVAAAGNRPRRLYTCGSLTSNQATPLTLRMRESPPTSLSLAPPPPSTTATDRTENIRLPALPPTHYTLFKWLKTVHDKVSMEKRRNERAGGNGRTRENPPTKRHRPTRFALAKIRSEPDRAGIEPRSPCWEASSLAAQPPCHSSAAVTYDLGALPMSGHLSLGNETIGLRSCGRREEMPADLSTVNFNATSTKQQFVYFHCLPSTLEGLFIFDRATQNSDTRQCTYVIRVQPVNTCRKVIQPINTGSTVAERLAHSPSTKANWAQSPAGSPDFRKWESCRTIPLVGGSSPGIPTLLPALHSGAAPYSPQSPSSALKTSLLRAAQISSLTNACQPANGSDYASPHSITVLELPVQNGAVYLLRVFDLAAKGRSFSAAKWSYGQILFTPKMNLVLLVQCSIVAVASLRRPFSAPGKQGWRRVLFADQHGAPLPMLSYVPAQAAPFRHAITAPACVLLGAREKLPPSRRELTLCRYAPAWSRQNKPGIVLRFGIIRPAGLQEADPTSCANTTLVFTSFATRELKISCVGGAVARTRDPRLQVGRPTLELSGQGLHSQLINTPGTRTFYSLNDVSVVILTVCPARKVSANFLLNQLQNVGQWHHLPKRHCCTIPGFLEYTAPTATSLLASHLGEPVSIPIWTTLGFSLMGIVLDDAAGRRVFPKISRFPSALAFRRCSILISLHLIYSAEGNASNELLAVARTHEGLFQARWRSSNSPDSCSGGPGFDPGPAIGPPWFPEITPGGRPGAHHRYDTEVKQQVVHGVTGHKHVGRRSPITRLVTSLANREPFAACFERASFVHWLLHTREVAPFLSELRVMGHTTVRCSFTGAELYRVCNMKNVPMTNVLQRLKSVCGLQAATPAVGHGQPHEVRVGAWLAGPSPVAMATPWSAGESNQPLATQASLRPTRAFLHGCQLSPPRRRRQAAYTRSVRRRKLQATTTLGVHSILSWQQAGLDSALYPRGIIVRILVAVIKRVVRTALLSTHSHYCFLLITGSRAKRGVAKQLSSNHNSRRKERVFGVPSNYSPFTISSHFSEALLKFYYQDIPLSQEICTTSVYSTRNVKLAPNNDNSIEQFLKFCKNINVGYSAILIIDVQNKSYSGLENNITFPESWKAKIFHVGIRKSGHVDRVWQAERRRLWAEFGCDIMRVTIESYTKPRDIHFSEKTIDKFVGRHSRQDIDNAID
ncbi:hypothetical protein PR048_020575 [Dryococelus australis]|uniref:Uncharacterized protein n=1 Tax=Dryococelus australis TaxID=614101 RepID=A0ABQ9H6N3_9NEOP|nr:hypothetical protein PR048_020575 [Dryococelus australis]